MKHDITLFATADWDTPLWTNKQHVAIELARQGHRVLYVESFGLRKPAASGRDVRRIIRRISAWLRPPRSVDSNIWVWSPLLIPLHENVVVEWFNKQILRWGLNVAQGRLRISKDWLWTYSPITLAVYNSRGYSRLIYHCVDDISAQPGMAAKYIEREDERLSRAANFVFVTAPALQRRHCAFNGNTYYLPNVADFGHFSSALSQKTSVSSVLNVVPTGPVIGFVGAISSYKVNFPLLKKLAEMRPDWTVVLVGEIGEGDPDTDIKILRSCENIKLIKSQPYSLLPGVLKGFDVAIIPALINQYTTSMFPMKFFEYLAAGRRIVTTPLPALIEYSHIVSIAADASEFEAAIQIILKTPDSNLDARLALAKENTYESRTRKMTLLIDRDSI